MRSWLLIVLAVIVFIAQISFVPALRPLGVVPNIGLVLVALVGLYGTASMALVMAVCGGLALDLVSGSNFGLFVGLFMVVALTAGYIHRAGLNWDGVIMAVGLVIIANLVLDVVILGGLVRVASGWPVGQIVVQTVTELGLNSFFVVVLRPLVRWMLPQNRNDLVVGS